MPINRITAAALAAVTYAQPDIKKRYKAGRAFNNAVHYPRTPSDKIRDITLEADDGAQIPMRLFIPDTKRSDEVILFFHGGGWVTGNVESYTNTCTAMANNTGRRVLSVDYRLAPEYTFPRAPEDCYCAARALYTGKLSDDIGGAPNAVTLVGDSAGANLCAVVSLMARDRGEFRVGQQILFYPAVYHDHTENSPFPSVKENGTGYLLTSKRICDYMDLYMPDKEKRLNPYFAPLLDKDLTGQPRTLVITAEYDVLRDEGETYAAKLKKFGCDVNVYRMRGALHGFMSLPERFSHVKKAYELMSEFLRGECIR